ncbi:hypothetical protein AB5J55_42565 [Streptomyces sp. R11]|uniref:Transposase n=1 Tax=Streptomyces sp. R11 TaxID=3238625 RepID=A0AB39NBH5_9ACTN
MVTVPINLASATENHSINFGYRTYDHPGLNPYRRRRSPRADKNGRWEVHHNPYDPNRVWVRLPEGWLEVPWVHAGAVRRPFTAFTFDHVRRTVERRHGREEHEAAIAQALDALLRRASQGLGSRRERTVAARAQAAAQMTDPSPATTPQQWPAPLAPGASFGLPGSFTVPLQDADGWDADDIEDDPDDEDDLLAALADDQDAAAGHADEASEPTAETTQDQAAEQTLDAAGAGGMRIHDPYQEAQAW